jgi:hypothetical protein
MGLEAETADAPWAHGVTDFDDAKAAIQGDNVDCNPHPAGMYAGRGCDPETTSDGERAFSHQPHKAGKGGVSYRYLVSDSGSLGLVFHRYDFHLCGLGVLGFATGDEHTQNNDEENTGDDTNNSGERHVCFSLNEIVAIRLN